VPIAASETVPDTWDLYGSVTRYIDQCPYPRIACLAGKPYSLETFMATNSAGALYVVPKDYDAGMPYHQGPWPATGMPMSYHQRWPSILQYVVVDGYESPISPPSIALDTNLPSFGEFVCLWNAFKYGEQKPSLDTSVLMLTAPSMSVKELRRWMQLFIDFAKHCNTVLCQLPREFQECYFILHRMVNAKLGAAELALYRDYRAGNTLSLFARNPAMPTD
jgi:hypothetical protein